MMYGTQCKFCKRPITVEIDDEYASLNDPHGLIAMSACNRCSDLRVWRRSIEARLFKACDRLFRSGKLDKESEAAHRKGLSSLTQEYSKMIAKINGVEGSCWDEAIVDALLAEPRNWGEIISRLWQMFRQWQKENHHSQAELV